MFCVLYCIISNLPCRDDAPSRCGRENVITKGSSSKSAERTDEVCIPRQIIRAWMFVLVHWWLNFPTRRSTRAAVLASGTLILEVASLPALNEIHDAPRVLFNYCCSYHEISPFISEAWLVCMLMLHIKHCWRWRFGIIVFCNAGWSLIIVFFWIWSQMHRNCNTNIEI